MTKAMKLLSLPCKRNRIRAWKATLLFRKNSVLGPDPISRRPSYSQDSCRDDEESLTLPQVRHQTIEIEANLHDREDGKSGYKTYPDTTPSQRKLVSGSVNFGNSSNK